MNNEGDGRVQSTEWQTLKNLVADALERPRSERARFIEHACPSPDLRDELAALIEAAEPEGRTFVLDPRADAFAGVRGQAPSAFSGTRFGDFTLGPIIGEGASGAVYIARQAGVERDVALKVFAPQSVGFDARLRFEREVRALGRVTHPGVARIYDAGLHADPARPDAMPVPYIAMELVEGLPLTRHVASNYLSLRAKVALIADAAEAVHAAHQRGVIHRDLKPANILVARADDARPFGAVKVLDFGIARVLQSDEADGFDAGAAWHGIAGNGDPVEAVRTTAGLLLGSLGYMAPEQARGEDDAIDVRTDVYALGILLHELITGRTPVPVEDLPLTESLRRLADPDVRMPRIDDDFTGGDLSTVLRTALAPEADRRYASAEALADDLRRLLRSEPIAAKPATRAYLARKFVRRHRVGVGAASVVALSLLAGATVAAVGLVREREARLQTDAALVEIERQKSVVETQRRRAEASRDFLAQIVASADPESFGRDATVIEAVRAALPMLATLHSGDPGAESSLRQTVAQTFRNLGVMDEADQAFAEARALAERAFGPDGPETLTIALEHADLMGARGDLAVAREIVDAAAGVIGTIPPGKIRDELDLSLLIAQANLLFEEGEYVRTVELYARALETVADEPALLSVYNTDTLRAHYGLALSYAGELDRAESVQREVVSDRASRFGEHHPRTLAVMQQHAGTLADLGELDEAEALLARVLPHAEGVWGATHHYTLSVRHSAATIALTRGDYRSAAEIAGAILDDAGLAGADPGGFDTGVVLFLTANTRAVALASLEAWEEAIPAMRLVAEIAATTFGPGHHYTLVTRSSLANMLGKTGDREAAIAELTALLAIHERERGADDENALITRNNLGMLHLEAGRAEHAADLIQASLDGAIATGRRPMVPVFRRNLGRALTAAGRYAQAEAELRLALQEAEELLDESQVSRTGEALDALYELWNRE
ncbi:MAG: serine/threonine protein kinase [Phycisphaerales bacterium]|nr:MAG: serine/threonine protein kinase [Phycisphaerales bacterium]